MIFPISPRASNGKSLHAFWDGFLDESDINKILAAPQWLCTDTAQIGRNSVDDKIRSTKIGWYYPDQNNVDIWRKIESVVAEINKQFFKYNLTGFYEPAQLGFYSASSSDHYSWHTDSDVSTEGIPRKLTMILMLDDPQSFEGGELEVKLTSDDPIKLEQKRGRAWFFPSFVLHRVTPVTKGTRRSMVIWVGGPEFK
jgi:PKHD-type hydroxylase